MSCFSFTAEISEERTLTLPPDSPTGRVSVAITPAECKTPSGRRLLAKLHDLQAAIPPREGLSKEEIDAALENDRAFHLSDACRCSSPLPWLDPWQ